MTYKGYEIREKPNEWGFYEATSINDCDAYMLFDKTLEGLKTIIDEQ